MSRTGPLLLSLALAMAACKPFAAPPEHRVDVAGEHARVRALLYDRGLIQHAEVQRKMSEYVVRMRRDGLQPETAYHEFHVWLEEWLRNHPGGARVASP